MCTTGGSFTPSCRLDFQMTKIGFGAAAESGGDAPVRDSPFRARRRPSGERMTSGCLRTAPCGARLLSIHISTVLTTTATKTRRTTRAVRKAV